jgi:hypothetical protein
MKILDQRSNRFDQFHSCSTPKEKKTEDVQLKGKAMEWLPFDDDAFGCWWKVNASSLRDHRKEGGGERGEGEGRERGESERESGEGGGKN